LVLGFLVFVVYGWIVSAFQTEQEKLAAQYHIAKKNVVVEPKPHGCEFDDAPLGNKHCHYHESVETIRACGEPDCRVTSVYVSWKKIED
jgi:hypothetical protein